jgi:predicted DCC family thiol-disulfide oxidoreductase YuxK
MYAEGPILLFDGCCNLCNRLVIFIIKRDPEARIRFASLQSDIGKSLLKENGFLGEHTDSIVLILDGNHFIRSLAVLNILKLLGGGWKFFYIFIIIPRFILDFLYDLVARNRYKVFGKSYTCMVPSEEIAGRFLS